MWEESKHPRDEDGRFTAKNGTPAEHKRLREKGIISKEEEKTLNQKSRSSAIKAENSYTIIATQKDIKKIKEKISTLGEISDNSILKNVLKDRIKNKEFGISLNYEKHIENGHGNVFKEYKEYLPKIVNNPDYIFEGNKENRVVLIKRIDSQIEVVLELSLKNKSNQIITMFKTTNKNIRKLEKKFELLYKRK